MAGGHGDRRFRLVQSVYENHPRESSSVLVIFRLYRWLISLSLLILLHVVLDGSIHLDDCIIDVNGRVG